MSSIRLFVLGSLADRGAMHGHALRVLAEQEHIDEWTDFTVGAVYGVLKRLATEGLIEVVRTEREGNYPERQVYDVTSSGSLALDDLRREGLEFFELHPDAFDLAFSRLDPDRLDELEGIISTRIAALERLLEDTAAHHKQVDQYLWKSEQWAMSHQLAKLEGEIAWHHSLLTALPEIISDELTKRSAKGLKS
ncbi:PadR family transcriptional regulator [Glaciihabitans sp. INWT7]|uniref:PadR family transcriptional regulator n=1 Tax=Glaciihabitans sp. INWT7 TaxID=2596912 RepID=UPI001624FDCA|nr:PadR family transcriptional regulator [Glaciihabitans sp. INWT7]QNE46353.1 PadR family transcriptional regulator [Glaciihabitans sp. INWT7]